MPVMDEFKEEREALKKGTPKQKLMYFWDYYKWHVIIAVAAIAIIATFINQILTKKDIAFYACMMNSSRADYMKESPDSVDDFGRLIGINEKEEEVFYDTSIQIGMNNGEDMNSSQKFMIYLAASEFDVMVTDAETNLKYAYMGYYHDLRSFLTEEQFLRYKDHLYYVDGNIVREISQEADKNNLDYVPVYKDPMDPESMEDPIPVGIYLPADSPIRRDYMFLSDEVVVSAFINSTHPDKASSFIDFCLEP